MLSKLPETAVAIWKMQKIKYAMNKGFLRPKSSLIGPQTIGPKANPKTKREVPRVITKGETLNIFDVTSVVVLKTDEAKVTQRVIEPSTMV
jgi:hypothetical protein